MYARLYPQRIASANVANHEGQNDEKTNSRCLSGSTLENDARDFLTLTKPPHEKKTHLQICLL